VRKEYDFSQGQRASVVPHLAKLIDSAVEEEIPSLTTETYMAKCAARGSADAYHAALAKVPDIEPEEFDWL
jgi:hypothetical protein